MLESMSLPRDNILCIHNLIFQYLNDFLINIMCYSTKKYSEQISFSIKCKCQILVEMKTS